MFRLPQRTTFAWLATLVVVWASVCPAAVRASCCCEAPVVQKVTAACCGEGGCCSVSQPVKKACCATYAAPKAELARPGCQCDTCECFVNAAPPVVLAPLRSQTSSDDELVAVILPTVSFESILPNVAKLDSHPRADALLSAPLREVLCVWVI